MIDIAVVDYGMGNLRSVAKALEHVAPELDVRITDSAQDIRDAARVVFPGQGAMPDCMRELDARGLRSAVLQAANSKPFLGICLGLQMLLDFSEEGNIEGLGLFSGKVEKFHSPAMVDEQGNRLKVPHMGWNQVEQTMKHPLWQGVTQGSRFYFVHSYYVVPTDISIVAGETKYPTSFACAVAKDNIFAVQFHPEKSQIAGLTLLSNFVLWEGGSAITKLRKVA